MSSIMEIFLFFTLYVVFWVIIPTILEPRSLSGERIPEQLIDTTVWRQKEPSEDNWVMNYFIAGLFNQPETAYSFFDEHNYKGRRMKNGQSEQILEMNGPSRGGWFEGEGITYVPYHFDGDDFGIIAECIMLDIIRNEYEEVRIFGISVGCKAIKYLNNMAKESGFGMGDVEISCYEINPCWTPKFLKSDLRKKLHVGSAALSFLDRYVLGWFGFIPVIRQSGNWFSPKSTNAMLKYIANDQEDGYMNTRIANINEARTRATEQLTQAVIISKNDEFLNNEIIKSYYRGVAPIYEVGTSHGNTIGAAADYYRAFQKIRK